MPIFKGPTKDQDRLGVPALMRKRTLYSRKRAEPMPLTALDRKKAGLPPPGLEKGRKRKSQEFLPALNSMVLQASQMPAATPKRTKKSFNSQEFFNAPEFPSSTGITGELPSEPTIRLTRKPRAITTEKATRVPRAPRVKRPRKALVSRTTIAPPQPQTFAMPLMDFYATPQAHIEEAPKKAIKKPKNIGTVTHYYDKIKVGVIKLSSTLIVGDCIRFQTLDGDEYEQVVESMEVNREPVFKAGKGKEIGLKLSHAPKIDSPVTK